MLKLERKLKNHFKVTQAITSNWDPNIDKLIGGYAGYYCSIQVHF